MDTFRYRVIVLILLAALSGGIIMAACVPLEMEDQPILQPDQPVSVPGVTPDDVKALVTGNNAFAFDLYQSLRDEDGNLLYSPYSISEALAMAYGGARGETARQMAGTLHLSLPQEHLPPVFKALDLQLESRGSGAQSNTSGFDLHIANALWGQEGYPFLPEYLDRLAGNYGSSVKAVDFRQTQDAVAAINTWASENTEGRIPTIVSDLVPSTTLVLANAVYFNAKWSDPFDEEDTYEEPFYLLDGQAEQTPMMHQSGEFRYAEGDGYQAIELPYQGGQVAMAILLPATGRFPEIEEQLSYERMQEVLAGLAVEDVILTMPKFSFASDFGLSGSLAALGMPVAFSPDSADFSGMAERRPELAPIFIGAVAHRAFIEVDEKRTEAAAVTALEAAGSAPLSTTPPPKVMKIDRPFIFLIRDLETDAILFVGRLMRPSP